MIRSVGPEMLHHLLCGYIAFLPFVRWIPNATVDRTGTPALTFSGPFLVGAGIGATLLANVGHRRGSHWAARLSLLCLAAGSVVQVGWTTNRGQPEQVLAWHVIGGFLTGVGFCGLWSPGADRVRNVLSTTQRWLGMRIWSLMLFLGAFLAILVTHYFAKSGPTAYAVNLLPAVACIALMFFVRNDSALEAKSRLRDLPAHRSLPGEPESQVEIHDSASNDCDAEVCCGGSRDWLPLPLWVGAGLAAIGTIALWVLLVDVCAQQDLIGRILLIVGVMLGTWLFQSTLPDTGYAILLVPFLLMGMTVWLGMAWFESWQNDGIALLVLGVNLGAISYGCTGLVCESFEESCRGVRQTTVFLIGHMAATAFVAMLALRSQVLEPALEYDAWRIVVFPAALVMLRCIPSPVISSRGRDEPLDAEDAAEAAAVLADTVRVSDSASLTDTASGPNTASTT